MSPRRSDIIGVVAIAIALSSPPASAADDVAGVEVVWPEWEQSCGVASSQLGVPIIRDLDPSEFALLDRINRLRAENGVPVLAYAGDDVRRVAQSHSQRMLDTGHFAHCDERGFTAGDRLTESGVNWRTVGENLLEDVGAPSSDTVVAEAVEAWIRSPDHRANLLDGTYTETAVGIASRNGRTVLTQLFLAR